jgi:hypothetical protein
MRACPRLHTLGSLLPFSLMIIILFCFFFSTEQEKVADTVFSLIRLLLHHALQHEPEGWRIFVDSLAILHGQVQSYVIISSQIFSEYNRT